MLINFDEITLEAGDLASFKSMVTDTVQQSHTKYLNGKQRVPPHLNQRRCHCHKHRDEHQQEQRRHQLQWQHNTDTTISKSAGALQLISVRHHVMDERQQEEHCHQP